METRRNLIVGAFVVAMIVAFLLWIAILAGRTGATNSFFAHYDNVTGIAPGTQVFFEGYRVGIVDAVELSPESEQRFRVDMEIARDWQIPEDSVAEITASGLLSAIIIDIRSGSSPTMLQPDSEIHGGLPQGIVAALSSVAGEVTALIRENIEPLLEMIGQQAPEILENLNSFSAELNVAAQNVNRIVGTENGEKIGRILTDVEDTTTSLSDVAAALDGTRLRLDGLLATLNELVERNSGDVSQVVIDLRDMLETLSPRVDAISHNLEVTTRNLNEFSVQIRENPGVIVRGRSAGEGTPE
jgi:phospholipid/cholesterol/gamma-HCH transport system substrate-binding protein